MWCLFRQDALDEYNRLKDIKKVGRCFTVDFKPVNICQLLCINHLPNVSLADARLPDEEAPLQVSEGQTEPHQEDGERLRPPGVSDPCSLWRPSQMWQQRLRWLVEHQGEEQDVRQTQGSRPAAVKHFSYYETREEKHCWVSLAVEPANCVLDQLIEVQQPLQWILFSFTLLLIVVI